jgi:hypothetical protein
MNFILYGLQKLVFNRFLEPELMFYSDMAWFTFKWLCKWPTKQILEHKNPCAIHGVPLPDLEITIQRITGPIFLQTINSERYVRLILSSLEELLLFPYSSLNMSRIILSQCEACLEAQSCHFETPL